jgi:signal transduction histidine kinase/ActR/RegA family two-component response regulator
MPNIPDKIEQKKSGFLLKQSRRSIRFKRWLTVSAASSILVLFGLIAYQFASTWKDYNEHLGASSATESWLNRKLISYKSIDSYDMLLALRRLEAATLRHAVGNMSQKDLSDQRKQVASMFVHFAPGSIFYKDFLVDYPSFDPAYQSTLTFLNTAQKFEAGLQTINVVLESADTALGDWMMFTQDTIRVEIELRDGMESTIISFRPLAERTFWIISILLSLFAAASLAAIYAGWGLIKGEQRRFSRFELLVSSVGHDLLSPLQAIQGAGSLLATELSPEKRKRFAGIIRLSSQTLARLVGDILQISQDKSLDIRPRAVPLEDFFSQIAAAFESKAEARGLVFRRNFLLQGAEVKVDPERLSQCVGNLLENALRYTELGSVTLYCRLDLPGDEFSAPQLVVEVSDTGIGIPIEDQSRVFEPFEQVKGAKKQGMGLGLSIVRSIVTAMHGEIRLESVHQRGSKFTITLPVVLVQSTIAEAAADAAPVLHPHCQPVPAKPGGAAILVVDDDELIRISVVEILRGAGYNTDEAPSGEEALTKVLAGTYQAVVSDIQMGGMDGFELAQSIRQQKPARPYLIAMTAHTRNLGSGPKAAMFDGFLGKPFSAESLLEQLDKARGRAGDSVALSV